MRVAQRQCRPERISTLIRNACFHGPETILDPLANPGTIANRFMRRPKRVSARLAASSGRSRGHIIIRLSSEVLDRRLRPPGAFKIAASWSYGTVKELKNYGICCEEHRDTLFKRAAANHEAFHAAEGEVVGPLATYRLVPGARDADLQRID